MDTKLSLNVHIFLFQRVGCIECIIREVGSVEGRGCGRGDRLETTKSSYAPGGEITVLTSRVRLSYN